MMKKEVYMKWFILKHNNIKNYLLFFVAAMLMIACQSTEDKIIEELNNKPVIKNHLAITYPQNHTVFPPEFISPTFIWNDTTKNVKNWFIIAVDQNGKKLLTSFSNKKSWRADSLQWEMLKNKSLENEIKISIIGVKNSELFSASSVFISTSKDSVNAPIFYRDIPLPFRYALHHLQKIRYRLCDISKDRESKIMLEKLPVCGNCHSFSADGKTIGMDVDYANDKGSYVIADIEEETPLTIDRIITWSDYKREDGQATFGLLSQISPDGRYVASMVKDRSIFIAKDDDIAYSQLFFPIKGIIVIYDRKTKKMFPLKGADDPKYCQANPNWSPDGKYIVFSREKAYHSDKVERYKTAVIPAAAAEEFLKGQKEYKYDLYKIPFNNGKGGKAMPLKGASHNRKSNYFAKFSPNGKWIVFTQAENFMLLQPDSKLMIIPSEGGEARALKCNSTNMNSWHSWSPNGKWLVFSSKARGAYTQLYLTHIDDNGNDTPPVLLENIILPNRAVNIPEFVNLKGRSWKRMIDAFSDSSIYILRAAHNYLNYGQYPEAIKLFTTAIKKNPKDYTIWYGRALAYQRSGMSSKAIRDFKKAQELNPDVNDIWIKLADIYVTMKKYDEAEKNYKKALSNDSKNAHAWSALGIIQAKHKKYNVAIESFTKAIKVQPDSAKSPNNYGIWYSRALAYQREGKLKNAIADYKTALSLKPDFAEAMINLSSIYNKTKNFKAAAEMNDKVIALNPPAASQWYQIGVNCTLSKQYQTAIDCFTNAINLNPKDALSYYKRGLVQFQIKQKNSGCIDLEKSLQLGYKKAKIVLDKFCK
jgi:tetratricopeptide (TPR) repeat protein